MSAGIAQKTGGPNAGDRVEIQASATGSREQLHTTQAAKCASAGNTTNFSHGQGSARQPQSGSHTAPPLMSPPQAGVQKSGLLYRVAGQLHQHIAPISVPAVHSGVVGAVLGKLHKGMSDAVEDFCLANVPDEEVIPTVRRLIHLNPDALFLNMDVLKRKLQLAKGLCGRYQDMLESAQREAELRSRLSYVPANDGHLLYQPNPDPNCRLVFWDAHEYVPSIWGELFQGGNTAQEGMPPASLGDVLFRLPSLVVPGVQHSLTELRHLNGNVAQGCNSAHAEIARMEACYMYAIAEYEVCMAKHTGLVMEVCEFEHVLLVAAGGPMCAGMAPVHRQAAHGQGVADCTSSDGDMHSERARNAGSSWGVPHRES